MGQRWQLPDSYRCMHRADELRSAQSVCRTRNYDCFNGLKSGRSPRPKKPEALQRLRELEAVAA
jgi:hypothetical protein